MRLLLTPQGNDRVESMTWEETAPDILRVTVDWESDVFDFSKLPNTTAEDITSGIFEDCPVIHAERVNGELTVTSVDWRRESRFNMEVMELIL